MAQTTLQRDRPASAATAHERPGAALRARELALRSPALTTGVAVILGSTLLVLWARTRPGFDPFGWLVWGHQTVAGSLNTNAAPSWKPLPYVFTVPYALFGHYELWLWMITAVAVSLSGAVFAGRIAYRLTGAPAGRRWAALVAAVFAGLGVLGIRDFAHYILSSQSDFVIVALCLGAIDCHLSGRPRWAFILGALAALGRPEVWPFLAVYSIWAWREDPSMRRLIGAGVVLVVLLWFGIPALTSRSPFVAGSNALGSGRALHSDRVFGTIGRFLHLHQLSLEVAALLAVCWGAVRRDRVVVGLAAGIAFWVAIEIAFSLHGWPGLARYMFEPAAVMVVLAGVLIGRLLGDSRVPAWVAVPVVAAIVIPLVPAAISRVRVERRDLRVQRERTTEIDRLSGIVTRLGGASRLGACGEPLTRLEYQTILAWTLHVNVAAVGFKYGPAIQSSRPIVLFTPRGRGGWVVQALHQRAPGCRSLP